MERWWSFFSCVVVPPPTLLLLLPLLVVGLPLPGEDSMVAGEAVILEISRALERSLLFWLLLLLLCWSPRRHVRGATAPL